MSKVSKVSKIHCTDFNALNAMYVGDIGDGVCGFYATLYAEYRYHVGDVEDTLYTVAPRPTRREGSLYPYHPSCGFSGSPPCSPRRQLCI